MVGWLFCVLVICLRFGKVLGVCFEGGTALESMRKILVTGVSGFLGWHVSMEAISQGWDVVGVCFSHTVEIAGVDVRVLDLCDAVHVRLFLDELKPDAIIHVAAMANPNVCELQPELSEAVNVDAVCSLAQWCGDAGIPLVFTSTDLVFDGEHAPYSESDAVCPISVYGRHKVAAEKAVLRYASRGLVCRVPLMFGYRDGLPASFIGSWLEKLKDGEELTLFDDEFRTPVSGSAAAGGLLLALESDKEGILHLGGGERISRYDFGLKLCKVFGCSAGLMKAVPSDSIKMAAPRSHDVALDSSRAFALGYDPGRIEEQLQMISDSISRLSG
jgi:dTDP-4-dehydrorhamnose reductase